MLPQSEHLHSASKKCTKETCYVAPCTILYCRCLFVTFHLCSPQYTPPLTISYYNLLRFTFFKYLDSKLSDDANIDREVKCLFARINLLNIRRFARCSRKVKLRLFHLFGMCFCNRGVPKGYNGMYTPTWKLPWIAHQRDICLTNIRACDSLKLYLKIYTFKIEILGTPLFAM